MNKTPAFLVSLRHEYTIFSSSLSKKTTLKMHKDVQLTKMYKTEKQKQALLHVQVMIGTVKETSVVMFSFASYLTPFDSMGQYHFSCSKGKK